MRCVWPLPRAASARLSRCRKHWATPALAVGADGASTAPRAPYGTAGFSSRLAAGRCSAGPVGCYSQPRWRWPPVRIFRGTVRSLLLSLRAARWPRRAEASRSSAAVRCGALPGGAPSAHTYSESIRFIVPSWSPGWRGLRSLGSVCGQGPRHGELPRATSAPRTRVIRLGGALARPSTAHWVGCVQL